MRKIYGINGYVQLSVVLQVEDKQVRVTFSGGAVNNIGMRPATFETSDKGLQDAIENTVRYKQGTMFLVRAQKMQDDIENGGVVVEEVANVQQARAYFLDKGYEMRELSNKKDILAVASKEGVVFPNWVQ